jgi:hypothetical protein
VTWQTPDWWTFALLMLAAYRLWRLLAFDVILNKIRDRIVPDKSRDFLECPYCAGAWIVICWWLAWIAWPHWTSIVAVPFALSAVVGVFAAKLDPAFDD